MARSYREVVTCDLEDGEVSASESVAFSFGGKSYSLDLCRKHADEVRSAFERFAGAAHSTGRRGRGARATGTRGGRRQGAAGTARTARSTRPRSAAASSGENLAEIREWARGQGYAVGDRGRIPAEIRSAYDAAQGRGRRRG